MSKMKVPENIAWYDRILAWSLIFLFFKKGCSTANIPLGPVPDYLAYIFLVVSVALVYFAKSNFDLRVDWKTVGILSCLSILMFRGTLISSKEFPSVDYEILTALVVLLVAIALSRLAVAHAFNYFLKYCAGSAFLVSILNSVLGFRKFLSGAAGELVALNSEGGLGSSLTNDYNMSSLITLIGILGGIHLARQINVSMRKVPLYVIVAIVSVIPLLSGSRRYFIFWVAFSLFWTVIFLVDQVKNWSSLGLPSKMMSSVLGGGLLLVSFLFILLTFGLLEAALSLSPDHPLQALVKRYQTLAEIQSTMKDSRGFLLERGFEIWDSYTVSEMFFGRGFDYLEQIGEYVAVEYPHNPVVSAMLYSGIIGGGVVFWFLFSPLFSIRKLFQMSFFVAGSFVACLFFLIVSGNTFASVFQLPFFCVAARVILWSEGIMHESSSDASCDDVAPTR